jgi:hypothetical protein
MCKISNIDLVKIDFMQKEVKIGGQNHNFLKLRGPKCYFET